MLPALLSFYFLVALVRKVVTVIAQNVKYLVHAAEGKI
jgi:hypothetical protein